MNSLNDEKDSVPSDASAPANREQERSGTKGGRFVSLDRVGDALRNFDPTPDDDAGVFPSENVELAKVSPLPAEVATRRDSLPSTARRDASTAVDVDVDVDVPAPPRKRNWRGIAVAALGLAVLGQGAVMAYWTMTRGGIAAVTRQTGSVTVTSEPAGSAVAVDGAVRGQTPLTIALNAGAHTIVVGSGEQARSQSLTVTRGGEAAVHLQLPAPAVAPAPVAKGALQVTTDPAGARVWVDGEYRGQTPLTVPNLDSGSHAVSVRTTGDPINRAVTVQEGTTASLILTTPGAGAFASGWLSIQSVVPLQVLEKGALLGTTEMPRILLPAGAHDLELVNAALGFRATRSVTITAGQAANFSIAPPRGTLSINALPWAEVWIDGTRVGETPIGNYSLTIGNHDVLFKHPDLGEQHKTVTVTAHTPARVGVDMKKP